jgi:hypothetical protein
MRQACPQLAEAEMRMQKRGSGFDPEPTSAAYFAVMQNSALARRYARVWSST